MSNWRLNEFRGEPEVWCHDLGEIKRFIPAKKPEDENDRLIYDCGIVTTEDGSFVYGSLEKKNIPRIGGYDKIFRFPVEQKSPPLNLPDDAEHGYKFDPKGFCYDVFYRGKRIDVYCCDPRFLAIINLQWDACQAEIPYKTIKPIFDRVPTREAAIKYLALNEFTYDEPLADWQYDRIPFEKVSEIMARIGDYTPLLEGLEHPERA